MQRVSNLLKEPFLVDTMVFYDPPGFVLGKLGLAATVNSGKESAAIYLSAAEKNDYSVTGYDWMFSIDEPGRKDSIIRLNGDEAKTLIITKVISDSIPLINVLHQIDESYRKSGPANILDTPFDLNTRLYKHRLYIKRLNYEKPGSRISVFYLQGVLLTGKK